MKKSILLFGLIFLTIGKSYGQGTIYSCNWYSSPSITSFDLNNRDTTRKYFYIDTTQSHNIWQLGKPSKIKFDSAYSKPLALVTDTFNVYPNNNKSSFSFKVWTDCNESSIYFWHRINTDSLSDGGIIEYSIDSGATWNNIINSGYTLYNFYSNLSTISSNSNKPGFTGTKDWIESGFYGPTLNSFIIIRFTFTSDSTNTSKEGWMIDNINIHGAYVGINEIITNSQFYVFPNPTSDFITIQTANTTQFYSVAIKDMLGRTILTTHKTTLDLSKFDAGIYLVELTTDKGRYVKRVLRK